MFEQEATIKNHQGIHCRPSAVIMKSIEDFDGTIRLITPFGNCDQLSILGLMSLGLECGQKITLQVEGSQEEQVCRDLAALFETIFDFPPAEDEK